MFVKRKKNRSGTTSVVAEKTKGIYKELITIGVAKDLNEIDSLVNAGHEWISKEESRRHPQLDLYGEEREACDRAKKDAYNREKGIRRLEKAYKHGVLTKGNINKRGYNKFLSMDGEVKVAINYDRVADDSKWDGLKGYFTNTDIPIQDVYTAYYNLWHVERAFRIAKSKIEIRPMFHFTRKRIEAHICICFVALKVYKELERMLKVS